MDKYSTMQDKELVALFKEGSQSAFKELYIRYKDRLMYYCKRMMRDKMSSEDIVHTIFLQLLEEKNCLNPELSFWGYLHTLAQNRILDEFKRFDVHSRYARHILLNTEEANNQTEDSIIAGDYEKLLNELVESLSPRQREIFRLNRMQGRTYKEIAEKLQISPNTVREHATLALEKVKKQLSQHTDIHFKTVMPFLILFL